MLHIWKNMTLIKKEIIYVYEKVKNGGLGDFFKYLIFLLNFCIRHNIKFKLIIDHPIKDYIKFKHPQMIMDKSNYPKGVHHVANFDEIKASKNKYFTVCDNIMYKYNVYQNLKKIKLRDLFTFSDAVNKKAKSYTQDKEYSSIHLRLGDKFIENDKNYVKCKNDQRTFDENKLYDYIEHHKNDMMYFFCDNDPYRQKIKKMFNFINITNLKIRHISLTDTTDDECFNAVVEFAIMTNSKLIVAVSRSGFSILAASFNNVPLITL